MIELLKEAEGRLKSINSALEQGLGNSHSLECGVE